MSRSGPFVGRADHVTHVVDLVAGASVGRAGTLLISGEAGVGKTALVRASCSRVAATADTLWAPCLPLTSLAVPFLPLATAVRTWAGVDDVPPPVLRVADGQPAGSAPVEFDAWLEEMCRRRTVVLVADDLQWADQSSLDVLMYVLAGAPDRSLATIVTVRSGEEGRALRRWLADVRRLPGVRELRLGPLDRVATAEQIGGLLGRPPREDLVDDVFARAQGNPYLTSLLVRDLPADAGSLPPGLPAELREAVARSWHGLSAETRELTRLVAVAGRPHGSDMLVKVAVATGVSKDALPALQEAVDVGVLEAGANGAYWFTHPVLAEVLEEGLLPEKRRALHAAFATALQAPRGRDSEVSLERAIALAEHHLGAGQQAEAYRWALHGADAAERAGGNAEALRLLRQALDLVAAAPPGGMTRLDLLQRIRAAAERTADLEEEFAAVNDLLALLDRDRQPLLAAELLAYRMSLRTLTGRAFTPLDDVQEAVRLSAGHPDSPEHALAMAQLAWAELWHDQPQGQNRAAEAVRLARACGSAKALSYALSAVAQARLAAGATEAPAEQAEARAAALQAQDFRAYMRSASQISHTMGFRSGREIADEFRRGREEMTSLDAPHIYTAWLSANEAHELLLRGDWRACLDRLRFSLGSTPGPWAGMLTRLTAALLASRQGRFAEAEAHLARAEELCTDPAAYLGLFFAAVRAELAVMTGELDRGIAAALEGIAADGVQPYLVERLVPLAARAAADQAQVLRDRGGELAAPMTVLDDLWRRYPMVARRSGTGPVYRAEVDAMQAVYLAELQRGHAEPAAATGWVRAADACAAADLPWDDAYANWRAAEAFLRMRQDVSVRAAGIAALRRAHQLAGFLQAAPLLAEVEALARSTRVSPVVPDGHPAGSGQALPGLTRREREVLEYVVAGWTYREIARELVVSEKTVSVHISNLLRKTGSSNRVELAQLARRLNPGDSPGTA
jgi:DNA-binding CsgD family transcriptional regulator